MNKIKKLQEDKYFRLLALLGRNPEISQRQLAKALDLSLGGINYALRALVERGMVKAQNFSKSEHKIRYVYMLTPRGFAEKTKLTAHFLKRKMDEFEALKVEIESLKQLEAAEGTTHES